MTTYLSQNLHFAGLLSWEILLELHVILEQLLIKSLDNLILSKAWVRWLLVDWSKLSEDLEVVASMWIGAGSLLRGILDFVQFLEKHDLD